MTHCGETHDTTPALTDRAALTVGEMSRDPRALDVLKQAGINHCCGAHLTLAEAAAAAGVPLVPLLARLDAAAPNAPRSQTPQPAVAAVTVPLDVRGLEPPEPMVRILERLDTLAPGATLDVVHDRHPIFLYPQLDARGFAYETEEEAPGRVRIRIRHGKPAA